MTADTTRLIKEHVIAELGLDVDESELDPDYDLFGTGVLDSIGAYTVAAWLVRRFGLNPQSQDVSPERLLSVRAMESFVTEHSRADGARPD